jgi:hypothetical protein
MPKKQMEITINDWPLGKQKVIVYPVGQIETRASGLRYLRVRSFNGFPFSKGCGDDRFFFDMYWYNEKDILVTPSVEDQFKQYCEKSEAQKKYDLLVGEEDL